MKKLFYIILFLSLTFELSCSRDSRGIQNKSGADRIGHAGQGGADTGGGNLKASSDDQVIAAIKKVKSEELALAFQRLKLQSFVLPKKIRDVLDNAFAGNNHNSKNIFEEIRTRKYVLKRRGVCTDKHNNSSDASFEKGEVCFSLDRLRRIPPQDLVLNLVALAAHEHIHSYNYWDEAVQIQNMFLAQGDFKNLPLMAVLPDSMGETYKSESAKFAGAMKLFAYEFVKESTWSDYEKAGRPNLMTIRENGQMYGFGQFNQVVYEGKMWDPIERKTIALTKETHRYWDSKAIFMSTGNGYQDQSQNGYFCEIEPEVAVRKKTTVHDMGETLSKDDGRVFICDEKGRDFEIRKVTADDFMKYSVFFNGFHNGVGKKLEEDLNSNADTSGIYKVDGESNKVCGVLGVYVGLIQNSFKSAVQKKYQFPSSFVETYGESIKLANDILAGYCNVTVKDETIGKIQPIEKFAVTLIDYWHQLKGKVTTLEGLFSKYYYLDKKFDADLAAEQVVVE